MRARGLFLVVAAAALMAGGLLSPARPVQAAEALDLQTQFIDALNRGDAGAAEALLTSDFVILNNADCVTPCEGRSELQVLLALRLKIQVTSATESGDTVRSRIVATSGSFELAAPGVTRILADTRVVVRGGKIALLDIQLDLSDPQSAALAKGFRESRGPQTGPLDIQNRFAAALNSSDLAALRNLVTSDFSVQGNIGCNPCPGDAALQLFVTIRLRITVLSASVSGNTVTSRVAANSPRFDLVVPGLERVLAQTKLATRDGKVSSLEIQLDTSDSLSAALAAELATSLPVTTVITTTQPAAAAPSTLPSTGDGGFKALSGDRGDSAGVNDALGVLGLAAATGGLALTVVRVRRRAR